MFYLLLMTDALQVSPHEEQHERSDAPQGAPHVTFAAKAFRDVLVAARAPADCPAFIHLVPDSPQLRSHQLSHGAG